MRPVRWPPFPHDGDVVFGSKALCQGRPVFAVWYSWGAGDLQHTPLAEILPLQVAGRFLALWASVLVLQSWSRR